MILRIKQIILVTALIFCASYSSYAYSDKTSELTIAKDSTSTIESLITYANKHLNYPYRSSGSSTKGFDCSGFVRYCFKKLNITLPHSSAAQSHFGSEINTTNAKPGDLIFFKGQSTKSARIGHVGIITEVTPSSIQFIHSAFKGGIRYDVLHSDYYKKRFVGIRRLIEQ